MNGLSRVILDTNALIALLAGERRVDELIQSADWIGISLISVLEYRASPRLIENDEQLLRLFLSRVSTIDITTQDSLLLEKIITVRRQRLLKLPDAVIAASAMVSQAALVTRDAAFNRVDGLKIVDF